MDQAAEDNEPAKSHCSSHNALNTPLFANIANIVLNTPLFVAKVEEGPS